MTAQPNVSFAVGNARPSTISSQSVENFFVDVTATMPDGSTYDPSDDIVAFAFLPVGSVPESGTSWTAGTWVTTGAGFTALILIGLTGFVLAAGEYCAFVMLVDDPEAPVLAAGLVTVY